MATLKRVLPSLIDGHGLVEEVLRGARERDVSLYGMQKPQLYDGEKQTNAYRTDRNEEILQNMQCSHIAPGNEITQRTSLSEIWRKFGGGAGGFSVQNWQRLSENGSFFP